MFAVVPLFARHSLLKEDTQVLFNIWTDLILVSTYLIFSYSRGIARLSLLTKNRPFGTIGDLWARARVVHAWILQNWISPRQFTHTCRLPPQEVIAGGNFVQAHALLGSGREDARLIKEGRACEGSHSFICTR